MSGETAPTSEPLFFGDIDPDNHRNHREYADAPTCARCGKAVRGAGVVIAIAGDFIVPNGDAGMEYTLGRECAGRVPATHRRPLTEEARERIMARDREYRAQRSSRFRSTGFE
jgi:hypothetical protein